MSSERNLKLINFFALFSNAWFFVPVLLPYCKDQIGVGYQGMLLSEAVFAASCVIFDVPTGWISDVWKRKYALALGASMNFLGTALLLFAHDIWMLFLSQIIMGIGISLFNGTHTALLYDSLLSLNRQDEYRQREGKRQALSLYGIAAAGMIGGLVYSTNRFLPIYLCMLTHALVVIACCAMIEPARHQTQERRNPVKDILDAFKYVVGGHEDAGLVILMAALLFCTTKCIMWTQQAYFMALNIPVAYFGVLMAIGWALGGASSHAAHLLDGKVNNFRVLVGAMTVAAGLSIGAGIYLGYLGAVLLIVGGSCIYGTISPRVNEIVNQNVVSSRRATLLSTQTFLASLLFMPVSSMVGWITDKYSIQPALLFIALWIGSAMLTLFLWKRRHAMAVLTQR